MILAAMRSSAQFIIRVVLGAVLLPLICSACLLVSLVALCSDKQVWRACTEAWNDLCDWGLERLPAGAVRACFSRIRREKHAPEAPEY